MSQTRTTCFSSDQAGVTLIEVLIAMVVLSIGLVALAELFVIATMNTARSTNVSQEINDAQRLIEDLKIVAANEGVEGTGGTIPVKMRSGDYATSTDNYDSEKCTEFVYVLDANGAIIDENGDRVDAASYFTADGHPDLAALYGDPTAGLYAAPSKKSRLVICRMVPENPDLRFNQTVTLVSVINGR
jgi:prepilin-type N-terminal cleavage/methylation domain-containing protein